MSALDILYCAAPDCGGQTAADEFRPSPEALRKEPLLDVFCMKHVRDLINARKAKAAGLKVKCRRDDCTAEGTLYPSGRWCRDHVPPAPQEFLVSSSRRLQEGSRVLLAAGLAGRSNTHLNRLNGKQIEDVELPANRAENEKNQDGISEGDPESVSTEAILYSTECPPEKIPTSVKSAIKAAQAHGWNAKCTIAIASDEMFSVQLKCTHHNGQSLTTRHEQPVGKAMGFKVGWFQKAPRGLPHKIGWREAMSVLKGEDPTDDRPALITAMETVMDIGGEVVSVEVTG